MKTQIVLACSEQSDTNQVVPYLVKQGWQIILAETGLEALTQTEQNSPFAVIVYASLPDITGGEVIDKIRQNPEIRETVVILVMSAKSGDADIKRGWQSGVDVALREPVEPMVFVDVLLRIMNVQQEEALTVQK